MPRQRKTAGAFIVWEAQPSRAAKKGQGAMPLAGCRGGAPAGVWGNAPTVPRQTYSKGKTNKGAGSEASLPVTSRVLRRAPQAALPNNCAVSRQMGATKLRSCDHSCSFPNAGDFAPAGATRGLCGRPLDPFAARSHVTCFLSGLFMMTLLFPEQRNCNPWRA